MKCPKCDGTGKAEIDVGAFTIHGADCDRCNGKGVIEQMTNEEWFCDLSTEEKADKLTDFSFWLVPTIPTEDKREQIRKKIADWLKQPHTPKE